MTDHPPMTDGHNIAPIRCRVRQFRRKTRRIHTWVTFVRPTTGAADREIGPDTLLAGGHLRHDGDDEFLDHRPLVGLVLAREHQQRCDHPHHPTGPAPDGGGVFGAE